MNDEELAESSTWGCLFWLFVLIVAMFFNGCFTFIGVWLGKF